MNGGSPVQAVIETDADLVSHIGAYDQRLHLLIGLRRDNAKFSLARRWILSGILFQDIHQAVGVVIAVSVVNDRQREMASISNVLTTRWDG